MLGFLIQRNARRQLGEHNWAMRQIANEYLCRCRIRRVWFTHHVTDQHGNREVFHRYELTDAEKGRLR